MKLLSTGIACAALLIAPMASARDAGIAATIRTMMDGFNKGDIAAVKAIHVTDPTIVDNVAPFAWSGVGSFDKWLGDLAKSEAAAGKSDFFKFVLPANATKIALAYTTTVGVTFSLTVNGVTGNVPDPRVKVKDAAKRANDGITPLFQQQKFIAQTGGTPHPIASWNEAQLIYAEAVGGQQGFDAINRVRTANGVPVLTGPVPTGQAFIDLVLEERRRQLFSEGQRYGDMLRYNLPFTKGLTIKGNTYSDLTCVPLPDVETRNNPNFKTG